MAILIDMPKLSDTMEEGGVSEWFKKEGEFVEEGELLLAIETDKATMEYASPEEGTLLKILVNEGATVALRKPIAVLGDQGEAFNLSDLVGESQGGSSEKASGSDEASTTAPAEDTAPGQDNKPAPSLNTSSRIKASPLAKKIAADKGIDLASLKGSGPNGRIIQRDLSSSNESSPSSYASPSPAQSAEDVKKPHTMMRLEPTFEGFHDSH